MVIGFKYSGKIYKLHGQSILTRMFHISWISLLPSIPLNSIIYNKKTKKIITINLNIFSLIIGYTRSLSIVTAFISWVSYGQDSDINDYNRLIISIAIFLLSYIISLPSLKQIYLRRIIGAETGILTLPRWLFKETQIEILNDLLAKWEEKTDYSWESAIKSHNCSKEMMPLLFSIIAFKKQLDKNENTMALYKDAYKMLKNNYSSKQAKQLASSLFEK